MKLRCELEEDPVNVSPRLAGDSDLITGDPFAQKNVKD